MEDSDTGILNSITQSINHSCQFLNEASGPVIKDRSNSTVFVGKDSAPLLVSLKNLGDTMFSNSCCDISNMHKLAESVPLMQKNSYLLEDHRKMLSDFRQNIEIVVQGFKKLQSPEDDLPEPWGVTIEQTPQTVNLSNASEISSFSDKDIVSSSPINKKL